MDGEFGLKCFTALPECFVDREFGLKCLGTLPECFMDDEFGMTKCKQTIRWTFLHKTNNELSFSGVCIDLGSAVSFIFPLFHKSALS